MATLRCRPSESEKEPIMVFMSATQMLSLKLKNGDLCSITWKDQNATAVAWLTSKADLKEGVIGVSRWLQDRCRIKLENKVTVERSHDTVQYTEIIPIRLVEGELTEEQKAGWAFNAQLVLSENYRYVVPEQKFFVGAGKQKKEFQVLNHTGPGIYKLMESTKVIFGSLSEKSGLEGILRNTFDKIGGLHSQKRLLKRRIQQVGESNLLPVWYPASRGARGVLLWGPPGTGKTLLRRAVEAAKAWSGVFELNPVMRVINIPPETPQLVQVDLVRKPNEQDAQVLRDLFRKSSSSTLILAEIQDPNDLPTFLRNGDTFADEIEVSVPDASARAEILSILCQDSLDESLIQQAAARTHGYVGSDLVKLLREMFDQMMSDREDTTITNDTDPTIITTTPTIQHLELARTKIRPSALQQVFFEKPNIKWTDIGGQEIFKQRLKNAVEWPLKYPDHLKAYNLSPVKGILLYGPPGCSKTMLVRALATESDNNFLAVKGAELISMYVGESERAIREVFRKARAASPCIIFFDEIDAIARRASGSSELNVLTTLLNEMDGFDKLKGVFVVAATNKPQVIDPALMRPGRFDNAVYIGPPDPETRAAIFKEQFGKVAHMKMDVWECMDDIVARTDGLSGADVVSVCQQASELAFKRAADSDFQSNEEISVTTMDVYEAISRTPRSITAEMLREYEDWNASRGR